MQLKSRIQSHRQRLIAFLSIVLPIQFLQATFVTLSLASEPTFDIQSTEITESSGLAISRRETSRFWTHNDSGGEPKLFAMNQRGEVTGSILVTDTNPIDWEDIATFQDAEENWILIADIGDNTAKRNSLTLLFLKEPDPNKEHRQSSDYRMQVSYPTGARDCEAIAVDMQQREIIFVTKSLLPVAQVYSTPLPNLTKTGEATTSKVILQYRGSLAIPLVSAMDIEPKTGKIVLVNYFQCFSYTRRPETEKNAWIKTLPEITELPKLKQIEAVAITADHEAWVTSEGIPGKLSKVRNLNGNR